MTKNEAATILGYFAAAYPNATVTEETAYVWGDMLREIDPLDGLEAARRLMKSSKFFPSVAEFLEAVKPLSAARRREQLEQEWEGRQLEQSGSGRKPTPDEVWELVRSVQNSNGLNKPKEHNHRGLCPIARCPWNSNPEALRAEEERKARETIL